MSDTFCKTGYPRRIWSAEEIAETHPADDPETPWHLRGVPVRCKLDTEADRYEYTTILKEDERLSTYVPLWLLAWGANMNIQYCTAASFLSYIAKYVPKPETSGMVADNEALRARDNRSARMVRYLNARKVGAPEVVYDIFQYKMKEGQTIVHLTTQPPEQRRRCLHRRQAQAALAAFEPDGGDEDDGDGVAVDEAASLRFYDGLIEKYEKRPDGESRLRDGTSLDWDELTYPRFWRLCDVVRYDKLPREAILHVGEMAWPLGGEPTNGAGPDGSEPPPHSKWVVARDEPMPIWSASPLLSPSVQLLRMHPDSLQPL